MWLNHEFVPVEMSQATETVVNHCWGGKTRKLIVDPKCLKMSNVIQILHSVWGQKKSLWESVSVFAYCHKLLNLFTFLSRVNNWKPIEFDSPIPLIPFTQKKKKIEEDFHSANWQKDLLAVPTQIEGLTRNFQCRLLCSSYPESPLPRCPTQREKTGKSFIYRQQQEQQQT